MVIKTTTYYVPQQTYIQQKIKQTFGQQANLASAIFQAESGLRTTARGDNGKSIGLAQIHIPAHKNKIDCDLTNIDCNLKVAKIIWDGSGPYAWSAFKSGAFKTYLK